MVALVFALMALSAWRVTHLVVEDTLPLVARPRAWVVGRKPAGNLAYLLGCTYCSSVWVAAPLPPAYAAALSILAAFGETVVDWLDRYGVEAGA